MKTSFQIETHDHAQGHLVRALLRIEGEVGHDATRTPLNLALVLDRSGSMSGGKLEAVKRAARDLVLRLHPDDHVSVVAFDDQVHTVARAGTGAEQAGLLNALMALRPGGSTNLSGGWLQGRALVQEHWAAHGVNRIILLTDGLANQGVTDPGTLRQLCGQALEARVGTTTVGVGAGFDEELLAQMAEAGAGASYYIERLDQAAGVFDEELEGLLSIAAQNLTVRLLPRDAVSVSAVHHTYPSRVDADGGLILTLGDLFAREPGEVLADFIVDGGANGAAGLAAGGASGVSGTLGAAGAESGTGESGQLGLSGTAGTAGAPGAAGQSGTVPVADIVVEADVWTGSGTMERRRISLPVVYDPTRGAVSHPEVTKVFTLLEAARARRDAVEFGDRGEYREASNALREMAIALEEAGLDDPAVEGEMQELRAMATTIREQGAMTASDRKFMYAKERMMSRGRRSAGDTLKR